MTGSIIGFYGFKGGAGRSLLCANFAIWLANRGKRVLTIDFDLEAPGLGHYLDRHAILGFGSGDVRPPFLAPHGWETQDGWMDLLRDRDSLRDEAAMQQRLHALGLLDEGGASPGEQSRVWPPRSGDAAQGSLHFLGPGRHPGEEAYMLALLHTDWNRVYRSGGALLFDLLGAALRRAYDAVLIDMRAGMSQFSWHVYARFLDQLVLVAPPTHQGAKGMAQAAAVFAGSRDERIPACLAVSELHGTKRKAQSDSPSAPEALLRLAHDSLNPSGWRRNGKRDERIIRLPRVEAVAGSEQLVFETGGAQPERTRPADDREGDRQRYKTMLAELAAALGLTPDSVGTIGKVREEFEEVSLRGVEADAASSASRQVLFQALSALQEAFTQDASPSSTDRKGAVPRGLVERIRSGEPPGSGRTGISHFGARTELAVRLALPFLSLLHAERRIDDDSFALLGKDAIKPEICAAASDANLAWLRIQFGAGDALTAGWQQLHNSVWTGGPREATPAPSESAEPQPADPASVIARIRADFGPVDSHIEELRKALGHEWLVSSLLPRLPGQPHGQKALLLYADLFHQVDRHADLAQALSLLQGSIEDGGQWSDPVERHALAAVALLAHAQDRIAESLMPGASPLTTETLFDARAAAVETALRRPQSQTRRAQRALDAINRIRAVLANPHGFDIALLRQDAPAKQDEKAARDRLISTVDRLDPPAAIGAILGEMGFPAHLHPGSLQSHGTLSDWFDLGKWFNMAGKPGRALALVRAGQWRAKREGNEILRQFSAFAYLVDLARAAGASRISVSSAEVAHEIHVSLAPAAGPQQSDEPLPLWWQQDLLRRLDQVAIDALRARLVAADHAADPAVALAEISVAFETLEARHRQRQESRAAKGYATYALPLTAYVVELWLAARSGDPIISEARREKMLKGFSAYAVAERGPYALALLQTAMLLLAALPDETNKESLLNRVIAIDDLQRERGAYPMMTARRQEAEMALGHEGAAAAFLKYSRAEAIFQGAEALLGAVERSDIVLRADEMSSVRLESVGQA